MAAWCLEREFVRTRIHGLPPREDMGEWVLQEMLHVMRHWAMRGVVVMCERCEGVVEFSCVHVVREVMFLCPPCLQQEIRWQWLKEQGVMLRVVVGDDVVWSGRVKGVLTDAFRGSACERRDPKWSRVRVTAMQWGDGPRSVASRPASMLVSIVLFLP